jgi:hypothetical protein
MIKGLFRRVFQLTDDLALLRQEIRTFLELQLDLVVSGQDDSGEPDFHYSSLRRALLVGALGLLPICILLAPLSIRLGGLTLLS